MRTKECPGCGKEIEYRSKTCRECFRASRHHVFCVDCGVKIRGRQTRCWECHAKNIEVKPSVCIDCGKQLYRYYKNILRCQECRGQYRATQKRQWACIDCGVSVNRRVKRCAECDHRFRSGRSSYQRTENHKEKMRQAMTGRTTSWRLGKPHTSETKRKMREFWTDDKRDAASKRWKGENNPGYIHGNHSRQWPKEFSKKLRTQIRKRDGYICQLCYKMLSVRSRMVDVHHIDYDKHNNDPSNLITLCRSCHAKTNFNRDSWQNHFETLQSQREHILFPSASDHPANSTNRTA